MEAMWGIIYLSMVSACISFTVSEAKIFSFLREYAKKRSRFISDLLHCGYCSGFYCSAVLELVFQKDLFNFPIIGHIATWLIISWLSGIQWILMCYMFKKLEK